MLYKGMIKLNKEYRNLGMRILIVLMIAVLIVAFGPVSSAFAESTESTETSSDDVVVTEENVEAEDEVTTDEVKETEDEESDDEALTLTDEEYQVTLTIPKDAMPDGISKANIGLKVTALTDKEKNKALDTIDKDEDDLLEALDISLYDKETKKDIQPSDSVTVSIASVDGIEESIAVHRINDDNSVTELVGTVDGKDTVVFDTDHFTVYTITTGSAFDDLKETIQDAIDAGETDITINLDTDITWPDGSANGILKLEKKSADVTITINGKGNNFLRKPKNSDGTGGTVGTMIWVNEGVTLNLENITMDGNGHEYVGNGDYGWNGIDNHVKGVFIYNEGGTVNLKSGTVLTNAHTRSNSTVGVDGTTRFSADDSQYERDSNGVTGGVVKMVAPIVTQGGTVNMESGSEIKNSSFTAAATQGGNLYSAGAIIATPSRDGSTKATVNINGGTIKDNKVGFDYDSSGDTNIYRSTVMPNGTVYTSKDGTNEEEQTSARTSVYLNGRDAPNADIDRPALVNATYRTPGAGAILILASNLNISGGTISNNHGEVGAVGINGVAHQWDDLFVDDDDRDSYNKKDGEADVLLSWTGKYDVGLNSAPSDLKSTFNMTGGTITNNLGVSNGGVYVGRYGTMNMGDADRVAEDNDKIKITYNRSWANYGGGGIGLNSQKDIESSDFNTDKKDSEDAMPTLNMYSGTISHNHSSNKGGGIYVATDNAKIYGGVISNNQGDSHGGGIYVEMRFLMTFENITEIKNNVAWATKMSESPGINLSNTTYLSGQEITESQISELNSNSDKDYIDKKKISDGWNLGYDGFGNGDSGLGSGGGVWLCPEGQSSFGGLGTVLIHDNTAEKAGDDAYKVVASSFPNNGLLYMPTSDPAGGKITWYRDGGFTDLINASAGQTWLFNRIGGSYPNYELAQARDQYDRYSDDGSNTEFTGQINMYDSFALKSVINEDSLAASQSLVKVVIEGNTSPRGGGIGSNGRLTFSGESLDHEENSIEVSKNWTDGTIKQAITINAYAKDSDGNLTFINSVELNESNGYKGTITGLPSVTTTGIKLFDSSFTKEVDSDGNYKITSGTSKPTDNLVLKESVNGSTNDIPYTCVIGDLTYVDVTDESVNETFDGPNNTYKQYRAKYNFTVDVTNSSRGVTVMKTWDTGVTPKAIEVQLYEGTGEDRTAVEGGKVELNEDNNWTYNWSNLDPTKSYSVKELTSGEYIAVYDAVSDTWSKTNSLADGKSIVFAMKDGDTLKYLGLDEDGYAVMKSRLVKGAQDKLTGVPTDGVWEVSAHDDGDGYMLVNRSTGKKLALIYSEGWKLTTMDVDEEPKNAGMELYNHGDHIDISSGVMTFTYVNSNGTNTFALDPTTFQIKTSAASVDTKLTLYEEVEGQIPESTDQNKFVTIRNKNLQSLTIEKVDSEDTTRLLEGATFQLWSEESSSSDTIPYTNVNGTKLAERETGESGVLNFTELENGTYYLVESKSPAGYKTNETAVKVLVSSDGVAIEDDSSGLYKVSGDMTLQVKNNRAYIVMPNTGAMIIAFFTLGMLLLAIAFVWTRLRKRLIP